MYDAIHESPHFRFILPRAEGGGGHIAQGYARVSGKAGVLLVTSGPGATNLVTPLADAMMDGTPLVALTGQVSTGVIGTDAFQEADTVGITRCVRRRRRPARARAHTTGSRLRAPTPLCHAPVFLPPRPPAGRAPSGMCWSRMCATCRAR